MAFTFAAIWIASQAWAQESRINSDNLAPVNTPATAPTTAPASQPDLPPIIHADAKPPGSPTETRNMAWQIGLEATHFSPGMIDGRFGRKSTMALGEFIARDFPGVDPSDPRIAEALGIDLDHVLTTYKITDNDLDQVGPLSDDWNEKAKLSRMTYPTLLDAMAERFHTSQGLMQALNPRVKFNTAAPGTELWVPNLRPFPDKAVDRAVVKPMRGIDAHYIRIDLAEKTIRVFDAGNRELALFHCSVAKDKNKLPTRDLKILNIVPNPNYTFDPKYWPDVTNVEKTLLIPPGPRNPVGMCWIALDLPGYGMHGNPKPELIGKTGSHGCFRLTNWDALKLASMVKIGMLVKIENPGKDKDE